MKRYVVLDKEVGKTPLEAILSFKKNHPEYQDVPMTYAGRLDPMASGKLLILIGDECKVQEKYHALDKQYQFEMLIGFSTDTGDLLGIPRYCSPTLRSGKGTQEKIKEVLKKLPKKLTLPYPHYSSKTVGGKPLFLWTLEDRLHEIEIPTFTSEIYKIKHHDVRSISKEDLRTHIHQKIDLITPVTDESKKLGKDFRRKEIHQAWDELFDDVEENTFQIASFTTDVSSGMYIRSLAPYIGKQMGTCALAHSIHRSKIGNNILTLSSSIRHIF